MKKKLKKSKALNKRRTGKKKSFFGRISLGKGCEITAIIIDDEKLAREKLRSADSDAVLEKH